MGTSVLISSVVDTCWDLRFDIKSGKYKKGKLVELNKFVASIQEQYANLMLENKKFKQIRLNALNEYTSTVGYVRSLSVRVVYANSEWWTHQVVAVELFVHLLFPLDNEIVLNIKNKNIKL